MSSSAYDFIIIGSGFGGSVSAMRLSQKGYTVCILEKGKRYTKNDFPKTNWNIFKFLWAPIIRCFGIQQITLLKGVMVLHGAGVGGGSLVYANTLMEPDPEIFQKKEWPQKIDWHSELKPFYNLSKKMLGVTRNKILAESDFILKELSDQMGFPESFHSTEVGVYFGEQGKEVSDPYFCGQGPSRVGCTGCGGCMIGCRVGAKNTLDLNYLYFAEKWGAKIFPQQKVTKIVASKEGGYEVQTQKNKFIGKNVIISAGVIGTVDLLFRNKEKHKTLENISDQLGEVVRTNGESLLGATSFEKHRDLSMGIAIGSAFHTDKTTKIEAVRYPHGSDFMRLLAVPLTPDGNFLTRPLKMIFKIFVRLPQMLRLAFIRDWAKQTLILLVMQSIDVKMRLKMGKFFFGSFLRGEADKSGSQMPSFIPLAQNAVQILARILHGEPQNVISEVLLKTPATAHILGGCCMGDSLKSGVIDSHHEVFGYKGLYVCDGSVVPVNLGVNPSLTITALAERFSSQFAIKSEELYKQRQVRFS